MIEPPTPPQAFEAAPNPEAEIDRLRRQAKQRFIGAALLVVLAVVTLPFVLDSQPRPVSPNVTILIPKLEAQPSPSPSEAPASASAPVFAPTAPTIPVPPPATPPEATAQRPAAKVTAPPPVADDGNATPPKSKYVVQVGSFADSDKVQAVLHQLDKAGIKYYTQAGKAKDGSMRTRVRLRGPFATRDEANSAAAKASKLGLAVVVLKP